MISPDLSATEAASALAPRVSQTVQVRHGRPAAMMLAISTVFALLGGAVIWFAASRIAGGSDVSVELALDAAVFLFLAMLSARNLLVASKPTRVAISDDAVVISARGLRDPFVIPLHLITSTCVPDGSERPERFSRLARHAALIGLPVRSPALVLALRTAVVVPWRRGFRRGAATADVVIVTGSGRDRDALRGALSLGGAVRRSIPVDVFSRSTVAIVARVAVFAITFLVLHNGFTATHPPVASVASGDLASLTGGLLRLPPSGCLDHFPSDPNARAVPCTRRHFEELISSADAAHGPGSSCASAFRIALGADAIGVVDGVRAERVMVRDDPLGDERCAIRYDAPVDRPFSELAPVIVVKGAWAQDAGVCLSGDGAADYRPVDCNQPHQAEVVSGPILRPDGADIGQLCSPPLHTYQAPAHSPGGETLAFVFRSDAPNVGRCLWTFNALRTGAQRSRL